MSWAGELPLLIFGRMGPAEIAIIVVAVLLIFGASRLPKVATSLGQGLRAFRSAVSGQDEEEPEEPKATKRKKVDSASKNSKGP